MSRAALPWLAVAFSLAACGDDGKVDSSTPPPAAAPPAGTATPMPAPPQPPPAPSAPARAEPTGWAGTHAGDWATWEVRAAGSDSVTRLTWRATRADAGRVAFTVESRTTAPDGRVLSSASSEEAHDAALDRPVDPASIGATRSGDVTVSGARLATLVHVRPGPAGDVMVWTSDSVPFSGVVRVSGGGVQQALVAFGRGR